jgi:hypothetical protein
MVEQLAPLFRSSVTPAEIVGTENFQPYVFVAFRRREIGDSPARPTGPRHNALNY